MREIILILLNDRYKALQIGEKGENNQQWNEVTNRSEVIKFTRNLSTSLIYHKID